jgi:hypothetical protein
MPKAKKAEAARAPKVFLGVKLAPGLKRRVERTAKQSTRSLSAEVEARLEQSLREQEFLGGPRVVQILDTVALAFAHAGQRWALVEGRKGDWISDPDCYAAGMHAAIDALLFSHPDAKPERLLAEIEALKGRTAAHFLKQEQKQ